jgi:hypothetical protein
LGNCVPEVTPVSIASTPSQLENWTMTREHDMRTT